MRGRIFNVYTLFVVILVAAAVAYPPFRRASTMQSLLGDATPLIMAAVAQLFPMLVRGIDLSVGSIMNVVLVAGSFILIGPVYEVLPAMIVCILLGGLLGYVNGILIARLRLPDFVITMATFIGYEGLALTIRPSPGGGMNSDVIAFSYNNTFGIPNAVWILIPVLLLLGYVTHSTRVGHYMKAIGSNRESSYLLALPVERTRILAYVMCGLCAGAAGMFLMCLIGTGAANAADPYQLDSIIATVVGGTSPYGGRGSVLGTLFGVLILEISLKALTYANLLGSYIQVFEGIAVVAVVGVVSLTRARHGVGAARAA
jgi:ribose/xylose/arabinose/galactoside ABC-type transport system permease subunit